MKRIAVLILNMTLLLTLVIAEGQQESSGSSEGRAPKKTLMGVGLGYNQTNYKLGYTSDYEASNDLSDYSEKVKVPSFDINFTSYSTRKSDSFTAGFLYDLHLLISSSPTYVEDDAGTIYTEDLGMYEEYGVGLGAQMIMGPGFKADFNSELSLLMGLGVHGVFNYMTSDDFNNPNLTGFGLGIGNITRLNWQLSENMGLMLGFDIAYDFLSIVNGLDGYDGLLTTNYVYASGSGFTIAPLILFSFSGGGRSTTAATADSGKSGSSGSGKSSSSSGAVGGSTGGGGSSSGGNNSKPKKPADDSKDWDSDPYD